MTITNEQPPQSTDDDLREYLARQLLAAKREDENSSQVPVLTRLPGKLSVGKLYYFSNAIAGDPVVTQEGLYIQKSGGMVFIV